MLGFRDDSRKHNQCVMLCFDILFCNKDNSRIIWSHLSMHYIWLTMAFPTLQSLRFFYIFNILMKKCRQALRKECRLREGGVNKVIINVEHSSTEPLGVVIWILKWIMNYMNSPKINLNVTFYYHYAWYCIIVLVQMVLYTQGEWSVI